MMTKYPSELAEVLIQKIKETKEHKRLELLKSSDEATAKHFEDHNEEIMPLPNIRRIQEILDVSFFASLTKEEGREAVFSITYVSKSLAVESEWSIVAFESNQPFTVEAIRKLSPVANHSNVLIGVFEDDIGELCIWGLICIAQVDSQKSKLLSLTIKVTEPGNFILRYEWEDLLYYSRGKATFIVDSQSSNSGLMTLINKHLETGFQIASSVVLLAKGMMEQGHGGTLLIVPNHQAPRALRGRPKYPVDSENNRIIVKSLELLEKQNDLPEAISPFTQQSEYFKNFKHTQAQVYLKSSTVLVSQLTAVDGAVVLNANLELLSFGAMIDFASTKDEGRKVIQFSPHDFNERSDFKPSEFGGGARHQSALHFCFDNPGSLALVASQDGVLSLLISSGLGKEVYAMRPFYPNVGALY